MKLSSFLVFDVEHAIGFLLALRHRSHEMIVNGGQPFADEMEQYAKANAPWTDRTGMARRTIKGINTFGAPGSREENNYYIGVCGNMPYSVDLELHYNKKYAILKPTLWKYELNLLQGIRDTISSMEGLE